MKRVTRGGLVALAAGLLAVVGLATAAGATITGATASKTTGLADGDTINISATATPNQVVGIAWCKATNTGAAFDPIQDCSSLSQDILVGTSGPTGVITNAPYTLLLSGLTATAGDLGNGVICDATHPCRLRLFQGIFSDGTPANQAFVGGTGSVPCATGSADLCLTFGNGATQSVPDAPYAVLLPLGTAAVLGAAFFVLRRRRPVAA